jgi:myo-inositol 2-dehydrogenase / D-chiro-inositol 1-dehydrogenase
MTLGIGIVGAGIMGADHARILRDGIAGARLAGIQDADRTRAREVADETGAQRVFETAEQMLSDPAIHAVLIASPDATHAPLALACLDLGKPVLCEKPLASTLSLCKDIMKREIAGGRRLLQVGYMRRFDPGYRAMRQAVREGIFGAPLLMHNQHRNQVAPAYITSDLVIANSMVHEFDVVRYVLGEDYKAVTVVSPRASSRAPGRQPQFVILETEGGVVVDIESFLDCQYGYDVRAELVCESGAVSLAPNPPVAIRSAGREGFAVNPDWRGRFVEAYRAQMAAWVSFAATGIPNDGSSAWDGYVASATASTALEALRLGTKARVDVGDRPAFYG